MEQDVNFLVRFDASQNMYGSTVFHTPFGLGFESIDDGLLEFSVEPLSVGTYEIKEGADILYFVTSVPMIVSVECFGEPFYVHTVPGLPTLLGSISTRLDYENISNEVGKIKILYIVSNTRSLYIVTWGDRIVRLGNEYYRLGD